jgi:ribose/xylose/arabinose/galactoside ABC-type transport system permease subunit
MPVTAAAAEPRDVSSATSDRRKRLILAISRGWAWVFLFGLILFFTVSISITADINFLNLRNTQLILSTIVSVLLMGLGQTFVIISGGIDLSVGWVMGLASVVSAKVTVELMAGGLGEVPAIGAGFMVALAAAAFVGLISGLIIAKLRVPSFIVTLGMAFIVRGVALIISGGQTVSGMPEGLRNLGNESLFYWTHGEGGGLAVLFRPDVSGDALRTMDRLLPWPVVVTAVTVGIAMFLLHKTQFGRHTYAIGGNREASVRAGVPADRTTILVFTLSAFTAGMAGILYTARFSGGSAIAGDPLLLNSIAAVIIGGVSMYGGRGNVIGTVIGALIIAILVTGLIMLQVEPFWQWVVVGIVVILAVLIDQARDLVIGRAESQ